MRGQHHWELPAAATYTLYSDSSVGLRVLIKFKFSEANFLAPNYRDVSDVKRTHG